MAWFKLLTDPYGTVFEWKNQKDIDDCRNSPKVWFEVADAQGTPLNGGSVITTSIKSPCCNSPMMPMVARAVHRCQCGNEYSDAYLGNLYGVQSAPVPKQNIDTKEEALRAKIIPAFRGEDRCNHTAANFKLLDAPHEPWFGEDNKRSLQSKRTIKRWISTNLREFPICRHSGLPCDLEFQARDEIGGDGQYLRVKFVCGCYR